MCSALDTVVGVAMALFLFSLAGLLLYGIYVLHRLLNSTLRARWKTGI